MKPARILIPAPVQRAAIRRRKFLYFGASKSIRKKEVFVSEAAVSDRDLAAKVITAERAIKQQIAKVIVGQDEVIEQLLLSIFVQGHCLIVGVPGLAKTLLVSTLAPRLNFWRLLLKNLH